MQYLHTDLPPTELFRLAQAVAQVDPSKITTCVVQGGIGNIGGASVVLPYTDQARPPRRPRPRRRDAGVLRLSFACGGLGLRTPAGGPVTASGGQGGAAPPWSLLVGGCVTPGACA